MTIAEPEPILNGAARIVDDATIEIAAKEVDLELTSVELVAVGGLINCGRYYTDEDERIKSDEELRNNPYLPKNEDDSSLRYDILVVPHRLEQRLKVDERLIVLNSLYRSLRQRTGNTTSPVVEA